MKPNLDLLRAVAVLCVLISHTITVVNNHSSDMLHKYGQLGVMLFFVHTSLVLMQSLDRQRLTGAPLFKRFYLQRLFRIYPLSIVFVLVLYTLSDQQWTTLEIASNLALTHNLTYSRAVNGVMWSLPLEVQMYVALPFLYVLFKTRPVGWLLALWLLSLPLAFVPGLVSMRLNVLEFVPCFLGGVIAWRMQGNEKFPGWTWPVMLGICTLGFVLFADPMRSMYGRWVACISLGLIIPWIRELRAPRLNLLSKTIAKYSYGIYLFHFPILEFAFMSMADRPVAMQWSVFLVLLLLLPYLGYHLIEHPMIKLGGAWSERKTVSKVAPRVSDVESV